MTILYANEKLSVDDMRGGMLSYRLVEMKLTKLGMKLDIDLITQSLRCINKYMTEKKLKIWISHNKSRLRGKNETVMPDEFLFIISNTEDRITEVKKLPTGDITLRQNKISGTY